jgi:uncharacterized membrane protein HdeD (DUF308 family)
MTTTKVISTKSPTWVRALQIGIGAVAIGLSLSAIIFPVIAVAATFTVAAIILLLFGIEQVVAGTFLYKNSRFAHIGLGILVIILSSLVIAYPLASAAFVVFLAAIALLFSGISSIIAGLRGGKSKEKNGMNTTASRGSRAFSIGAGALAVALSIAIMVTPVFGIALAGIVIGIAVLVYGVRLVVTGISGRKDEEAVRSTLSS